jgi:hypothetical protein
MRVVYKFPFPEGIWKPLYIEAPEDAKVVHVDYQGSVVTVWIELDPDKPKVKLLAFTIFGTGAPITDSFADHVQTLQRNNFVWHVYKKEVPI